MNNLRLCNNEVELSTAPGIIVRITRSSWPWWGTISISKSSLSIRVTYQWVDLVCQTISSCIIKSISLTVSKSDGVQVTNSVWTSLNSSGTVYLSSICIRSRTCQCNFKYGIGVSFITRFWDAFVIVLLLIWGANLLDSLFNNDEQYLDSK
jgi:hypothetical protein